jgi:hypothetical protein
MNIWDILWPIGSFCVHLVHYFCVWYHVPRKIWHPCVWPNICRIITLYLQTVLQGVLHRKRLHCSLNQFLLVCSISGRLVGLILVLVAALTPTVLNRMDPWDIKTYPRNWFYESPLRPKTFRANFLPWVLGRISISENIHLLVRLFLTEI